MVYDHGCVELGVYGSGSLYKDWTERLDASVWLVV